MSFPKDSKPHVHDSVIKSNQVVVISAAVMKYTGFEKLRVDAGGLCRENL